MSEETGTIAVQLIYAQPDSVWQLNLCLPQGTTVASALAGSGFPALFPEYPYDALAVGIYGQVCSLDRELLQGDRLEIYRPLTFDPMESRHRRAMHREAFMTKPKNRPKRRKAKIAAGLIES
ncbi:RnfH family protein [Candidimonas sp. SYP-B2681]|uniref:RnfH family protein n=1 Tax=Candidimonas sp. SYP-B2681 TaxID=2497686 RepID=UPI000F889D39|nr:RnfH family protein [Candidimonas sp. SYP-B2681]RTZ47964.1 RnfH family protein [Candidimonas sp. SYP-B2681]